MPPDRSLWKKYLEGRATLKELKELEAWLQSPAMGEEEWKAWIKAQDDQPEIPMPLNMRARLKWQLQQYAARQASQDPVHYEKQVVELYKTPAKRIWMTPGRMAAAAMILLVLTSVFLIWRPRHSPELVSDIMTWDSVSNSTAAAKRITLPDRTNIWLNQNSVLYVNKNYTAKRWVRLKGEGYFEVAPDAQHPFVAVTGNVQTLVLGTSFNIDNNPRRESVCISLVKGSVSVRQARDSVSALRDSITALRDGASVMLTPGETAAAGRGRGGITRSNTGVPDIAGWINGDLVMNQLPLSEALAKFGAYYGIVIHAAPGLVQSKTATAVYHRKDGWQKSLHHFLFIYHLTYKTDPQNNISIIRP